MTHISDLAPNPKNPRKVTDDKLELLRNAMLEFGDLGCVVYNRKTKQIVGGHQRVKCVDPKASVTIERKFRKPTKVGTVAEGFVELEGERFKYREVFWDDAKEKAANIAANKGAGEFDLARLAEWMRDLGDISFDLDFTMFDDEERANFFSDNVKVSGHERKQKTDTNEKAIVCPHCKRKFSASSPARS